jgi:hypothetical protein
MDFGLDSVFSDWMRRERDSPSFSRPAATLSPKQLPVSGMVVHAIKRLFGVEPGVIGMRMCRRV